MERCRAVPQMDNNLGSACHLELQLVAPQFRRMISLLAIPVPLGVPHCQSILPQTRLRLSRLRSHHRRLFQRKRRKQADFIRHSANAGSGLNA